MSFPEWGAGGQWVMVRARELSGISLCVYMCFCMWSFPPVAKITKLQPVSYCLSLLTFCRVWSYLPQLSHVCSTFQTVSSLLVSWLALVWSGLVWGGFVSVHSPLLFWPPTDGERWLSFIQFVYKFDHSCVKSMRWDCLSGAQAETVKLL